MKIKLTPVQAEVLAAVASGGVHRSGRSHRLGETWIGGRNRTRQVKALAERGLIRISQPGQVLRLRDPWEVTEQGTTVLAELAGARFREGSADA